MFCFRKKAKPVSALPPSKRIGSTLYMCVENNSFDKKKLKKQLEEEFPDAKNEDVEAFLKDIDEGSDVAPAAACFDLALDSSRSYEDQKAILLRNERARWLMMIFFSFWIPNSLLNTVILGMIEVTRAQANRTPADVWAELRKFGCLKSFTAFSQDVTPVAWKWLSRTIGAEDNKATQLAPERVLVLHVECLFAYVEKQLVEHMEQVDKLFDTVWRVLHKLDDITSQERIGTVNVKEFHVAMLKLKLIKSPVVMLNVLATLGFVADSKPGTRVRFADKVWPIVRAIHHEQSSEMWATLPPSDREIELQQWHMFWNILELQYLPKYLTDRLEMTFTNYLIDRNGLEAALDDVLGTLGMELYKEEMTYLWESCNWDSSETPIKKTQRFLRVLYLISLKRVFASVRHAGGWVPEQEDLEQSKWPAMDLPITLNAVDNSLERFREHLHPTCKSLLDPVGAKWNMLSWFSPDFIRFAPPKPPRPRDFFLAQMIADIVGNVPTSPMDRPKVRRASGRGVIGRSNSTDC
eukprot:c18629_g1_i2.p1 GENE.c18629_g1_i2~~c18629_g1_i2.p1  ORF type:complete len:532 (-),score=133.51 c18629_g1_i2:1218-2783(-)